MAKRTQNEMKLMYEEAIRQNIARKDWQKVSEVMIGAEKVGVRKSLRKVGWVRVGQFEAERGNHPSAIVAFNSARVLDLHPGNILGWMYDEAEAFCGDFDGRFSRQDLLVLGQALERVSSFYSFDAKVPRDIQDRGKKLTRWIQARLSDSPLKAETPATHHVQRIYAALYPPMTIEEVRAEFARIVEPLIRERLERGPMPASSGGGKGPKDPKAPEDESERTQEEEPKPKHKERKRKRRK